MQRVRGLRKGVPEQGDNGGEEEAPPIDVASCTKCGICAETCRRQAIAAA